MHAPKLLEHYLLFTPHSELFIDTLALINESEFFNRLKIQARSAVKEVYSLINDNHSGLKRKKKMGMPILSSCVSSQTKYL
jgi:hypothetical protein